MAIFNDQKYIPTNFGENEMIQSQVSSQRIFIKPNNSNFIINHLQKQTLQSEESFFNFFSFGIEKYWYSMQIEVER